MAFYPSSRPSPPDRMRLPPARPHAASDDPQQRLESAELPPILPVVSTRASGRVFSTEFADPSRGRTGAQFSPLPPTTIVTNPPWTPEQVTGVGSGEGGAVVSMMAACVSRCVRYCRRRLRSWRN